MEQIKQPWLKPTWNIYIYIYCVKLCKHHLQLFNDFRSVLVNLIGHPVDTWSDVAIEDARTAGEAVSPVSGGAAADTEVASQHMAKPKKATGSRSNRHWTP